MSMRIGLRADEAGTALCFSWTRNPVVAASPVTYNTYERSGFWRRLHEVRRVKTSITLDVSDQIELPDGWGATWRIEFLDRSQLRLEIPLLDRQADIPYKAVLISPEMSLPQDFAQTSDGLRAVFGLPEGFDRDSYIGFVIFELEPIAPLAHPRPIH